MSSGMVGKHPSWVSWKADSELEIPCRIRIGGILFQQYLGKWEDNIGPKGPLGCDAITTKASVASTGDSRAGMPLRKWGEISRTHPGKGALTMGQAAVLSWGTSSPGPPIWTLLATKARVFLRCRKSVADLSSYFCVYWNKEELFQDLASQNLWRIFNYGCYTEMRNDNTFWAVDRSVPLKFLLRIMIHRFYKTYS